MRRTWVVALAMAAGACSAQPVTPRPQSAIPPTISPMASQPVPAASPSPTVRPVPRSTAEAASEAAWIQVATDYARQAGFELAAEVSPRVADEAPDFDSTVLHRVSLGLDVLPGSELEDEAGQPILSVYLDDAGAVRVVDDGRGSPALGRAISRAGAIRAARRYLRQVGIDLTAGTVHVAGAHPGVAWQLTFDRALAGYRVANAPMGWWLHGDKVTVELRGDGTLRGLYAIQLGRDPVPEILATRVLDARLAKLAHLSDAELAKLEPELLWVRRQEQPFGPEAAVLSLAYCATRRHASGWDAWCVDAGTGELSAVGGGVD